MISEAHAMTAKELIRELAEFAFQYPSLDPDEYTEWDTQEWYDEEIESYADLVGEAVDRIDRGELSESALDLSHARSKGKGARNFDEDLIIVVDDDDRSWGPKRYDPHARRAYPEECLNRPKGWRG